MSAVVGTPANRAQRTAPVDTSDLRGMGDGMGGCVVKISVLMSVWRTPAKELAQSIGSILAQTYGDFEFLIVDDGNTDAELLFQLACYADSDPRIRLLREPHRGLTLSLNRGLEEARGEWIARQD